MKTIDVILRYMILFGVLFTWLGVDYHFYDIIAARGGWDAWVATNFLWQTAILYVAVWNIFGIFAVVIWWFTKED